MRKSTEIYISLRNFHWLNFNLDRIFYYNYENFYFSKMDKIIQWSVFSKGENGPFDPVFLTNSSIYPCMNFCLGLPFWPGKCCLSISISDVQRIWTFITRIQANMDCIAGDIIEVISFSPLKPASSLYKVLSDCLSCDCCSFHFNYYNLSINEQNLFTKI